MSARSERRRRRTLSFGRWAALTTGILLSLFLLAILYVRNADADYRLGEKQAIALARAQAGLTEADRAVSYTWDETLWIVIGKNQEGEQIIVWERESGIETARMEEGFTEKEILEEFRKSRPGARLIRVLPGWFHGMPVWEIRYAKASDAKEQGLDFYSFRTGQLLKTYTLLGE